jgi:predicted TIM-barrel fold metal-dependent hydrolase
MTIGAHHRIWRQHDLPLLMGPMPPRIFGAYEAIRRDYLIDEYLADVAGSGDTKSVYVQCNWAKNRFDDASKVTLVLQHAGMLEDLPEEGRPRWHKGMRMLRRYPNVGSKLSALGTFIHKNDPERIAAIVRETIDLFGANRCLFGPNFPVEKLWTSYADLIAACRKAIEPPCGRDPRDIPRYGGTHLSA